MTKNKQSTVIDTWFVLFLILLIQGIGCILELVAYLLRSRLRLSHTEMLSECTWFVRFNNINVVVDITKDMAAIMIEVVKKTTNNIINSITLI